MAKSWGSLRVSSPAGNLPLTVDVTTIRASLPLPGLKRGMNPLPLVTRLPALDGLRDEPGGRRFGLAM
jgi:hypothetical protein